MTPPRTLRSCACGCGQRFEPQRSNHLYFSDACRARASRNRRGDELPGTPCTVAGIRKLKQGRVSITIHVDADRAREALEQFENGESVQLTVRPTKED